MNYSNVYNELKDYPISDYRDFIINIDNSYKNITSREYEISNDKRPLIYFDKLGISDLHDSFTINKNNVLFDCLMTPIPKNCKSLFVIFSGSRIINKDKLPIFKRWSYYRFIDSIVLNIADPMFYEHENLVLGWYYGKKDISYLEYISEIIKKIQNLFGIDNENLFFFGSSGGGYASLQLSMYFKGTNHIAINPQISISKYHYEKFFTKETGIDLHENDSFRRNETEQIIIERVNQKLNKYLIVQNSKDEHDCTRHLFPLLNKLNIDSLHLGLNSFESITIWLYSCVGGHNAQGDQFIFSYILYLADKLSRNICFTEFDYFLFKNITVLWKQREYFIHASKGNNAN